MPGLKAGVTRYWGTLFRIFRRGIPTLILFEILYKVVSILIVKPLLTLVLQLMLRITGYQLVFNKDILGFFITPPGIIAAVVLIVLSALFIYYEFAVIIIVGHCCINGCEVTLQGAMERGFHSLRALRSPGLVGFFAYALLLLPIADMGYAPSLLPSAAIPNFVIDALKKTNSGTFMVFLIYAVIFGIFFCSLFTLPAMVLRETSFGKAFAASFRLIRKKGRRLLGTYAVFLAFWALLYKLPDTFQSYLLYGPKAGSRQAAHNFILTWQPFLAGIMSFLIFAAGLFLLPVLMLIVLYSYQRNVGTEGVCINLKDPRLTKGERNPVSVTSLKRYWARLRASKWAGRAFAWANRQKWLKKSRFVIIGVIAIVAGALLAGMLDSNYAMHRPIIIGHRGSAEGVENTLEAVEGAVQAGADYAEVDILLSADGVPMVFHDTNLSRLSGKNVELGDLTAQALQGIELSQNGRTGRIPTLREMVRFCKGKIRLVVEIKTHGKGTRDPVVEVFKVLEEEEFADRCIFVSLDYNMITRIKEVSPKSAAGFCVYRNVGYLSPSLLHTMEIDFIVVEEAIATPSLVRKFRNAWLPVYVWTVNDTQSMMRYLNMGILGLVTDYPKNGADALEIYNASSNAAYLPEDAQLPVT